LSNDFVLPLNKKSQEAHLFNWVYTVRPPEIRPILYSKVFYFHGELVALDLTPRFNFFPAKRSRINKFLLIFLSLCRRDLKFYNTHSVCIVSNPWSNNYYHWFCEVMPRLLCVSKMNQDVLFLFPFELNDQYQLPSIAKLSINYTVLANTVVYARKMLFTSASRDSIGHFFSGYFDSVRTLLLKKGESGSKIYIHRNSKKRRVLNEAEIKYCFFKFGYNIVELENATLQDQIDLFSSAKVIAGAHGAALTNMIFMEEGATVIEFGLKGEKFDKCYFNMARVLKHSYYHLSCVSPGIQKNYNEANLFVEIEELEILLLTISNFTGIKSTE
jgi:capsular polysaccharide biosynthesis protein